MSAIRSAFGAARGEWVFCTDGDGQYDPLELILLAERIAVGVGSGTDALRLTLLALRIGPGDEVIVPAFTAVPTIAAVCATGATPVPVDVDSHTP